jgi:hypothetical protein
LATRNALTHNAVTLMRAQRAETLLVFMASWLVAWTVGTLLGTDNNEEEPDKKLKKTALCWLL